MRAQIAVAVPVKDEEHCLPACLDALDRQGGERADHVVLLLNNCTDRSAAIAAKYQPLTFQLHVAEVNLPPDDANAGTARRLAFEAALPLAGTNGVILTTDADGRVDGDWIGSNLAEIWAGADAVAGWAEIEGAEWDEIPIHLHEDDARERAYDTACDELHALLDPDPFDPWPRHTQASGASIAVTVRAYRRSEGIPPVVSGEDRELIAALRRVDAKVRHSPGCRVAVSGRLHGRARGGMADTIRRRLQAPDAYFDERLELAPDCARRAASRHLLRLAYDGRCPPGRWWDCLGVSESTAERLLRSSTFGGAWFTAEKVCPTLDRSRVAVEHMNTQQKEAERLLVAARRHPAALRRALLWRLSVADVLR